MLKLPVYLRSNIYYFHTRINGKQIKRSLNTSDRFIAMMRACKLLYGVKMDNSKLPLDLLNIDLDSVFKFEIDLSRGILKADGLDDHARMMEALAVLNSTPRPPILGEIPVRVAPAEAATSGINLFELVDKFFNLKKQLKPSTVLSYKNTAKELAKFLDNPIIINIGISDITRYQEHLAKANSPRTIDNKIATLRTLFYFAIRQGYYFKENPAINRTIMSKTDKAKSGYAIFENEEISQIYQSENLANEKENDPDFYWVMLLGLFSGCRISEITSLKKDQFFVSERGVNYIRIRESKTLAGIRDIPINQKLFDIGLSDFIKDKDQIFKYQIRLGKGSGNAVGKKFKRLLEDLKIIRDKLVFHSLRKFTNDFFLNEDVPFEPRCQFFGHEIENVNVATYSKKFSVDKLAEIILPASKKLMILSSLIKTKF